MDERVSASAGQPVRKVVLGLGNLLQGDEGLGIHAVKMLGGLLGPQREFEVLDGGVLGMNLLPLVEECSHLLVLDVVDAGADPGTLVELRREEIPLYSGVKMSEHQITFQEVLGLASLRGHLPPHLHLIGVQPEDLSLGMDLSTVVQDALPRVVERAIAVLLEWESY